MPALPCYCPLNKKTGFCGAGSLFDCGGPPLNGAGRAVTSVSAAFTPVAIVFVFVLTIAAEPPSHMLVYTRLLSVAATAATGQCRHRHGSYWRARCTGTRRRRRDGERSAYRRGRIGGRVEYIYGTRVGIRHIQPIQALIEQHEVGPGGSH